MECIFIFTKMELSEAIHFLSHVQFQDYPQKWLDLGCGEGLFTQALSTVLPDKSTIIAVDKTDYNIGPFQNETINLKFHNGDMQEKLPFGAFSGILMANSLHYIEKKQEFLHRLMENHGPIDNFLLIEYDTQQSNPWIPYPISFVEAETVFKIVGRSVKRLAERPSIYGKRNMYLAQSVD